MKRWGIVLIVALLHGCSPSEVADHILVGGTIITVDPNDTIVEALAIKDGRILAVGTTGRSRRSPVSRLSASSSPVGP